QNEPPLALVAVIGGLGTPFLLNTGSGNIPGLTLYTCVVLAGSMAIYYFRPWVLLYWSSWVGGWIVMGIGLDQLPASKPELLFYSWSVQAGVLFIWILFWMVSIAQKRGQWKPSVAGGLAQPKTTFDCLVQNPNLHITVQMIASALISFQMSKWIWKLSDIQCGSISLAASAIFFLVVFFNWRLKKAHESSALHATVGTLLLTIALFHLLDNHHLFLAYALEATVLHYLAHRTREPAVEIAASSFFTAIGCWYFVRLFGKVEGLPIFNYQALVDVVVMSLAIYASTHINLRSTSKFYILAAYLGFLAWLLRELGVLPDGNSMVSIAWGLTGSTLMWMGLRRKQLDYFKGGFATLVLVAIKLMIIDLAHMEIIWRILIFIGFGTAFLMLSYWMKNMWKLEEPKSPA
ncbi:MAG: DUF2339 domain-containing protein, partial [Nitrospinota bacterium]|nr:DUF2339 domain-containing protein [Nitrospinota bacterium]